MNEITLSKPGKLKKDLKKSIDTITTLKVSGYINGEDIEFLVSLPKLATLNLENAAIVEGYTYPAKNTYNDASIQHYDKQTLLISGSHFFKKVVMPNSCDRLAILSPQPTDSVSKLEYFQLGTLVANKILGIKCSKNIIIGSLVANVIIYDKESPAIFTEVMDYPGFGQDYYSISRKEELMKQFNPCFIKSQQKNYSLNICPGSIDNLITTCKQYNITVIDQTLSNSFSYINCKDTLDLSQLNINKIGSNTFTGCPAKYIIMPLSIKEISGSAFKESNVEAIEFLGENAPVILEGASSWKFPILVPAKYYSNYQLGEWKRLFVKNENTITKYEFVIETPGTLSEFLTDEIIKSVESLTLKGILYDTDIPRLNRCKHLEYLDISCCYVAKSPQTIEREKANLEFKLALIQSLGEMAQENAQYKYEQGQISYAEAMNNVMWGQYAETLAKQAREHKIEADNNCVCPELDLECLKEYHMPMQIKYIGAIGKLPKLKKIVLPPSATQVLSFAFSGLNKIEEFNFPNTLEILGAGVFQRCSSLKKLDFSNTNLKTINPKSKVCEGGLFYGCNSLVEIRFPSTFKMINDHGKLPDNCILYFYSPEAQDTFARWRPKSIHVPRGTKAGWSRWITYGVNVIDDL